MKKRKFKFFRNAVIFIQSFVLLLTCTSPVFALPLNESNLIFNVKAKIEFKDLNTTNKSAINNAIKTFNVDGVATAKSINKIEDKEAFEIGVRKVLDKYYSTEKSKRGELNDFAKTIDSSATYILENYKEAEAERENQENLIYETAEIIVNFPYGTPIDTIETIVNNEGISYEIIDDGIIEIDENLPEYKKERLKAVENQKSDIIVSINTTLEDTVERAVNKFDKYDCVKSSYSNLKFEADDTISNDSISVSANDFYFNETDQWNLKYVDIPKAWNRFSQVSVITEVWVAVIDSGVKMNHPDLTNILMPNYSVDVTQTDSNGNYKKLRDLADTKSATGQYTAGHGTMVAGVIAAQGNNSIGIAGVGSVASDDFRNSLKIMAIKCDNNGANGNTNDRHITQEFLYMAVDHAVEKGAEVINISYSQLGDSDNFNQEALTNLQNKINTAINNGVCVVCSAGNDADDPGKDGTDIRYPAGFAGVIGVGASLKNGRMAAYSNRSAAVDIVAPGGYANSDGARIRSTNASGGYSLSNGTSYAAPHVAATVAMMKSINYQLAPNQVLSKLKDKNNKNANHNFKELDAGESVRLTEERQ